MSNKRFLKIYPPIDCDEPSMVLADESDISRHYDLADCDDNPAAAVLYLGADGQLHPVTLGKQERINTDEEAPFHYAQSPIMANGVVVGFVTFTDH